ncbi:MAG: glutaminyl-peptide cyclotransferase [bacterium]|nr:glutaminyl-peptide cyclotransferase [bacterium]
MVNSTAYYWRVDTKSGKQTTTGDVWSFTTVIGGKYTYEIINSYPHDPGAFTEGLIFDNGFLYEGTGLWGESSLRKVDLTTGEILQSYELPDEYFGEGITALDDKIYQLTYLANVGFVYDKETFELLDQFSYPTEGWGLTNDGEQLIMGDGSATLYFLDPITYQETGTVEVTLDGEPLLWLNELEYIDGYIYINVWTTDLIVIVDPASGDVVGQIDMTGLRWLNSGVLNGTAYDIDDDRLFVTGKKWQKLYEIKLVPTGGN